MAATHYRGSLGLMAIDEMPFPYLLNARDKLVREQRNDERQDEIDAMSARLKVMDEEYSESEAAKTEAPAAQPDALDALASELEGF